MGWVEAASWSMSINSRSISGCGPHSSYITTSPVSHCQPGAHLNKMEGLTVTTARAFSVWVWGVKLRLGDLVAWFTFHQQQLSFSRAEPLQQLTCTQGMGLCLPLNCHMRCLNRFLGFLAPMANDCMPLLEEWGRQDKRTIFGLMTHMEQMKARMNLL